MSGRYILAVYKTCMQKHIFRKNTSHYIRYISIDAVYLVLRYKYKNVRFCLNNRCFIKQTHMLDFSAISCDGLNANFVVKLK